MNTKPTFPIKVVYHEDGDVHIFNNEDEMVCDLEWFDTEDSDENASVTDANGQAVRLKIEALDIQTFELLHVGFTNDMDIDQSCNIGKITTTTKRAKSRNNNSGSKFVSTIGNGLLYICCIILFIPAAIIACVHFLSCSLLNKIKHGHQ
ncbi:hypothetical protein AGMMS50229_03060 [Campylobacterota bacterium]|nr:hypothetical protein AGMMS50229_03060 [Campylobacterota bacterium]